MTRTEGRALPKLLFAAPDGTVLEHPVLRALARSGDDVLVPQEVPLALPHGGRLARMPGHLPLGLDPETGRVEALEAAPVGRRRIRPEAVAAVLPPGYTRTFLPAEVPVGGPELTQWAYTAAGWGRGGAVAWALRTDCRRHWAPARFSTPELPSLVRRRRAESPGNAVLRQLERCALEYRCFTAQNVFYRRDEGALPASTGCNARCAGCISATRPGGAEASHDRIDEAPLARDLAEVAAEHLARARGRCMVSFGQGCEGEPLTRASAIAEAIRLARRATRRGSIGMNTNASLPGALARLLDAGLDSIRVSLNSAHPDLYGAYFQPKGYCLRDVEASLEAARARGTYVALNLLTMPGVTDRAGEVELLADLIERYRVDQLQVRSLCIDPERYLALARGRGAGGEAMGVRRMLGRLRSRAAWLVVGNFARGLGER